MKRFFAVLLLLLLIFGLSLPGPFSVSAQQDTEVPQASLELSAPSVLLMEAETGTVLYQKNEHDTRPPASITKIMTLNLIFEALEKNQISLSDEVTVSDKAASMGGSQVYLEPGEVQTVETMIKCISIASANDACVAMAEYICGSEEEFVAQMNKKAKELGMEDTNFVNCCGLDTTGHLTSANDVALMARELTIKHPQIHDYCTIWMENIIHRTKRGDEEFGLTNTNKLIKQYPYATGLKTGSTGLAKYCLAATAEKDGVELVAVIMAAQDPKARFADAQTLLNYGFSVCRVYKDESPAPLPVLPVKQGAEDSVTLRYGSDMVYVSTNGEDVSKITKKIKLPDAATAPVKEGDVAGHVLYSLGDQEIGKVDILYERNVPHAAFRDYYMDLLKKLFFL